MLNSTLLFVGLDTIKRYRYCYRFKKYGIVPFYSLKVLLTILKLSFKGELKAHIHISLYESYTLQE